MPKRPSNQSSRLSKLWKDDQTKLWATIQGVLASLLASVTGLASFLNSSEFQNLLSKLSPPVWVIILIAAFGCLTYFAAPKD